MANIQSLTNNLETEISMFKIADTNLEDAMSKSQEMLGKIKDCKWQGKNKVAIKDLVTLCDEMLVKVHLAEKSVLTAIEQLKRDEEDYVKNGSSVRKWKE